MDISDIDDDDIRLDVTREYEVEYWATRLRIHPQDIVAAIRKVGPRLVDVMREIEKSRKAA